MSNHSAEDTSESTGRSESSTPIQKIEKYNMFGAATLLATTTTTNAILTTNNFMSCQICEITFESPSELQVHFQVDHVVMRDGQNFRCPQKFCNKIFPNRFSLKKHIEMHFFGNQTGI